MTPLNRHIVSLYVDRSSRQWVVRDADGAFWIVPAADRGWDQRQPFLPDESNELESVPGHYKYMLGLPY